MVDDDDDDIDGYWPQSYPEVLRMSAKWRDRPREIVAIFVAPGEITIETKEKV